MPEADIEKVVAGSDRLPNLQLMEGPVNVAKKAKLPAAWMVEHYPDEGARADYRERHDLGEVPEDIKDFTEFYASRQNRIGPRLRSVLGVTAS